LDAVSFIWIAPGFDTVKRALISDVHSNLEALLVVLNDIEQQGISEIYCLGDVIGYGPNPRECLDLARRFQICILGNHDQAAMFDPDGFNPIALRAVYWTREQLEQGGSAAEINARWDFLGELPRTRDEGNRLYVHGSPREPTNEYVFPEDVYNQRKMQTLFDRIQQQCFQGHTHIPGVFTASGEFLSPEEFNYEYRFGGDKVMINVGSVGQPRDGDARACYTVLGDESIVFRRLDYDVTETIRKIYREPDLDNMLGDRLREGR
jgi:predicted phosphodiesterase